MAHEQKLTRRAILQVLTVAAAPLVLRGRVAAAQTGGSAIGPLPSSVLPQGVRSRFVDGVT